jgi:thiamine-phosphate pyrophosphorylase
MCDGRLQHILAVTNRQLCDGDFLQRIEDIARRQPAGIILREKDLSAEDYKTLAEQVLNICGRYGVSCRLHSFVGVAMQLGAEEIHLPLPALRTMSEAEKARFRVIGASCHSVEEALEAQRLGCTYITAGHVFATDCKKGLPPRGLDFLRAVCTAVDIPVYAIGGINSENLQDVMKCGAAGGCIMSGLMRGERIEEADI